MYFLNTMNDPYLESQGRHDKPAGRKKIPKRVRINFRDPGKSMKTNGFDLNMPRIHCLKSTKSAILEENRQFCKF